MPLSLQARLFIAGFLDAIHESDVLLLYIHTYKI